MRRGLGRSRHSHLSRRVVDNTGVKLALQVTGFEKRGGRLVEDIELPIGAVEELRGVFPGVRALQPRCPERQLRLGEVDYFVGVVRV